jgi:hypothetical protein
MGQACLETQRKLAVHCWERSVERQRLKRCSACAASVAHEFPCSTFMWPPGQLREWVVTRCSSPGAAAVDKQLPATAQLDA